MVHLTTGLTEGEDMKKWTIPVTHGGRVYVWRYRCPMCGKPYAKKVYWTRHIATHRKGA